MTIPLGSELKIGLTVKIELRENQGSGKLSEGIIKKILTSQNYHPHGILVELETGEVGRVKELPNSESSQMAPDSSNFEDLEKKTVPKVEDKFNEFKEFYQYDDGMDEIPDSLPFDKKLEIIEKKKQPVLERFATAICSFGNDRGGFVYLGVKSNGVIAGLEKDKRIGNFSNYDDEFANHMRDTLEKLLRDRVFIISKLQMKFTEREEKTICILQILPATIPLFLHTSTHDKFFVRGPSPRAEHLEGKEMIGYIAERFPNYHK